MALQARSLAEAIIHQWRHRTLDLNESWERCRRELSEPAVHELRLAARHLEPVVDVILAIDVGDKDVRRTRKVVRRIIDMTSDLRDLQTHPIRTAELPVSVALIQALSHVTMRSERKERRKVKRALAQQSLKWGTPNEPASVPAFTDTDARAALRSTLARARARLQRRLAVLDAKDPRSLHRVRVALKRHRYLLDAFRHHLTPKLDAERPLLKRLQQRLGAWHDERLFADRLEACAGDLPRQLRTECRALALGRRDLAQAEQHRLVTLLTKKRFR